MSRYFLIRRNLDTFVGPMTIEQMRDAYKKMTFGLQDEVAGHAGPWIAFDDLTNLRRTYPEIAKIVNDDMTQGWGMSDHSLNQIVTDSTTQIRVGKKRNLAWIFGFLVIAVFAVFAAFYVKTTGLSAKYKGVEAPPDISEVKLLLAEGRERDFDVYMRSKLSHVVEQATNTQEQFSVWVPYLRMFAFRSDGEIEGIAPKLLRGNGMTAAPVDCSKTEWKKRWQESVNQWPQLLQAQKLARYHWARLLAWDSHWISRRGVDGWLEPKNYYLACITMAKSGLEQLLHEDPPIKDSTWESLHLADILARLQIMEDIGKDGVLDNDVDIKNPLLRYWSCLEVSKTEKDLQLCAEPEVEKSFADYNALRRFWNTARIHWQNIEGNPAEQENHQQITDDSLRTDYYTRFDYLAEMGLIERLRDEKLSRTEALKQWQQENPQMILSH